MSEDTKEAKEVVTSTASEKADVTKMTDADIRWREKYKLSKEELERTKLLSDKERKELSAKLESEAKERTLLANKLIEAELKAQAVAAGIKDLDFVKLIDTKELKLNENGLVDGIDKVIQDFKSRKPDLFGSEKKVSSSTNAPSRTSDDTKPRLNARDMSKDDWNKNRSKFMAGKFN